MHSIATRRAIDRAARLAVLAGIALASLAAAACDTGERRTASADSPEALEAAAAADPSGEPRADTDHVLLRWSLTCDDDSASFECPTVCLVSDVRVSEPAPGNVVICKNHWGEGIPRELTCGITDPAFVEEGQSSFVLRIGRKSRDTDDDPAIDYTGTWDPVCGKTVRRLEAALNLPATIHEAVWPTALTNYPSEVLVWLEDNGLEARWSSCTDTYCIVGTRRVVRVLDLEGKRGDVSGLYRDTGWLETDSDAASQIAQIGVVPRREADPAGALLELGVPIQHIAALLAPPAP